MADIWISLLGSDITGDGSSEHPFKTLEHSFSLKGGDNKYIFRKDISDSSNIFEENDILFQDVNNITLLTDSPREVFIKTNKLSFIKSENITISGLSFIEKDPDNIEIPIYLESENSNIILSDILFQEIHRHIIKINNSILECNKVELNGKLSTLNLLTLNGISTLKGKMGILCSGEYSSGIIGRDDLNKIEISNLTFEGLFFEGLNLIFGTNITPSCEINNIIVKGVYGVTNAGITLSGLNDLDEVNSLNKVVVYNCSTGIDLNECYIIITNAIIHKNIKGIIAKNISIVTLKNSIITNNDTALIAETNSSVDISFSNLYNNDIDFPKEYIPLSEPEKFRIFSNMNYELLNGNIEINSESVKSEDGLIKYTKDKDYIFSYGSDFVVGNISRTNTTNIPDGEKIMIDYNFKNPENITGNITLGQRIRRVDPKYKDIESFDFRLTKYSPLIDAGIYVGYSFKGTAPDMGYFERSRPLSSEEAVTQLKMKALSDTVFLEPEVNNTINLQIDNLRSYNKDIDLSEGSAIRDLLIKPAGHLIDSERLYREYLMKQQSILFYEDLSEAEMDSLAANYMIIRKNGNFASGSVRLYFKSPEDIVIPSGSLFSNGDGISFFVLREQTFLSQNVSFNIEDGLYYIDVPIYSVVEGEVGNSPANSIRTSNTFSHPNLVNVNNPFPVEGGFSKETNAELGSRLKTAWTLRSLTSVRSIETVLIERFSAIRHITTVGAGDPLMERDVIPELIPYIGNYHTYGKVDIYLNIYKYITSTAKYQLDSNAKVNINSNNTPILPLIYIKEIKIIDTNGIPIKMVTKSEYNLITYDSNYRFSTLEELTLEFINIEEYANLNIEISYLTSPVFKTVQDYVNRDDIRNVCTDILIKSYAPCIVSCYIDYYSDLVIDISEDIKNNIEFMLEELEPGQILNMSVFSDPILLAGASNYSTPLIAAIETWMPTGNIVNVSIDGEFDIERNTHYFPGDIIINKIEV